MKIEFIHVQNFRKLKSCRIDLANKETIFVGANNSGKTSAMDAMIRFFQSKNISTRDFTLSNWKAINTLCTEWENEADPLKRDRDITKWEEHLPALDIWLTAEFSEYNYVTHLIPTLDWNGGPLGVRLRYEPTDLDNLCTEFCTQRANSKSLLEATKAGGKFKFWPKDMWEFLDRDRMLAVHFEIKAYLLDPAHKDDVNPQPLPLNSEPLAEAALNGIIKVDIINAQRGFSDVNSEEVDISRVKNLSTQLKSYYEKHLNPTLKPTLGDVTALEAIEEAKELFDKNLQESFRASLGELEGLNYPGFGNPRLKLSSRFNPVETINHDAAVFYELGDGIELSLPEKYNGLGYQNLISMIFKLIRFRDEWMQVGKGEKNSKGEEDRGFEPLHLVLIEEPEAHLHAQVQQVFIKEAYKVLRNHHHLKDKKTFTTQLVISTHSNHIAHEIDFISLRYFKREPAIKGAVSTSTVVNLSNTFGDKSDTTKFAIRYLRTTHCDLFFADAVILVEGPAEKMLVPHFIKKHSRLYTCYISILEIGGSHAHTLKPLIENLGIITLIITDIDAINPASNNSKVQPEKGKGYLTGNDTLKKWLPAESDLDNLLDLNEAKKTHEKLPIKIAYQIPVAIQNTAENIIVNPYTFEDCIVIENKAIFSGLKKAKGLLKKMVVAASESNITKAAKTMYDAITAQGAKKAEFALELLYIEEPTILTIPKYIAEGLVWLEDKLLSTKQGFPTEKLEVHEQ